MSAELSHPDVRHVVCPTPFTCRDPLDPAAVWQPHPTMPPDGFTVTGKRLEHMAAEPLRR